MSGLEAVSIGRLRLKIGVSLVAATFGIAAGQALACGSQTGTYSSNETRALEYSMTNYSRWMSDWTYNANRVRSDGTVAYHAYIETQGSIREHEFTNSIDVYRSTQIQRGGYGDASWFMEQWALGPC